MAFIVDLAFFTMLTPSEFTCGWPIRIRRQLAGQVGPSGKVIGIDMNDQMLRLARERCAGLTPEVQFVESPAYPLDISENSIDAVVCQQGFQFFPDKDEAAREIYRVLVDDGKVIVTTWRPVAECQFFGTICDALNSMGRLEIADMMRIPFDLLSESELNGHFESAGFVNLRLERPEQDLVLEDGLAHALEVAYSTPIGPKLRALSNQQQDKFRNTFTELIKELSQDGITMGRMVSNLLSAEKPT